MRAVVLSNDRIIELLNEKFVNTWVLNTDMKRLREAKGIDGMQPLARTIVSGWKQHSPVDCLVISPDLELMGRQPVNELFTTNNIVMTYQRFLAESLEGKRPGFGSPRHVALNVLDVQRTSAENVMNAFVEAFKNLDAETMLPMLTEDAREAFGMNTENLPEDVRTQMLQMLRQKMEVLSSEYVGDEFHFRLRVPQSPEASFKMRKVEGVWFIYDVK